MNFKTLIIFIILQITMNLKAQDADFLFTVDTNIFDFSKKNDLGLTVPYGTENIKVFEPNETTDKYSLGAVLFYFKGYFYIQWQSSEKDEDSQDTWVAFSKSKDCKSWEKPLPLIPDYYHKKMHTGGGWWSNGKILVAYINIWKTGNNNNKEGYTEYITSEDGINWSKPAMLKDINDNPINGVIEQDLHALPNGRIITAFHVAPGLKAVPYFTDNSSGISGWTKGNMKNLEFKGNTSRELEPSWFFKKNGNVIMVFRDQANSFKLLASQSNDLGKNWSLPVLTNMPDSRAKQSAGNLLDSTAFLVNCPSGSKERFPLVITLSYDGLRFSNAFLVRKGDNELNKILFEGKYKRIGYNYPKSFVKDGYIYIAYTTNKENVEITKIPLSSLKK